MDHQTSSRPTTPEIRSQDNLNVPPYESHGERSVTPRPTAAGLYSIDNRNRNRERLQDFARNADLTSSSRPVSSSGRYGRGGGAFDMSTLTETLQAAEPGRMSTPIQVYSSPRRRAGLIPNRTEEEMARDFEVGFLGELFVSLGQSGLPHLARSEADTYPGIHLATRYARAAQLYGRGKLDQLAANSRWFLDFWPRSVGFYI